MIAVTLLMSIIVASNCQVLPTTLAQAGSTQCQRYYVYTKERGCIKSCSHPDFSNCPDVFAAIWDPKFCALSSQGVWQSFTFACQACLSTSVDFIGVADGKCEKNGDVVVGPQCSQHQIYTKEKGCITACSDPKWKQCGDLFPDIYAPKYCALRKDGKWISFTFDCQACPNSYPNT